LIATLDRHWKRFSIGLDIGETGVRAVQLSCTDGRYKMARASRSDGAVAGEEQGDRPRDVADQVKRCLLQAEFRGRSAVAALNTPDVEFHTLELPQVKAGEMEQIVRWEVDRLTTRGQTDREIRYWTLPPTKARAPNAIGVSAERAVALQLHAACGRAGLACRAIDTAATALCRFGSALNAWAPDVVWGVLDLGFRETRLVMCVDQVPVLVRNAGSGGSGWTQRIAQSLQTSLRTAEVQKCDHGLAPPPRAARGEEQRGQRSSDVGSMLLGILRSDVNDLASEVKRSYEYVLSCYPQRRAGGLILTGGGAAMHNLPEFLTDSLGIPVHGAGYFLQQPACRLHYANGRQHPLELLALAAGLALEV